MRTRLPQLSVLLTVIAWAHAHAAPGDVDSSFVYPRPGIPEPDSTNAIPLADGFLIIKSRNFDQAGSNSTLEVTRIDEDGRLVPAFGSDGKVVITMPGPVNVSSSVKGLQNGSMLLAGYRRLPATDPDSSVAIVRLDATGRLDPTFGTAGVATLDVPGQRDRVGAIDVLADGRILAGVWSSVAPDPYGDCSADRVSLVRLNPDGTAPEVIYYRERNAFTDNGCRNTMTLQVMPDQRFYFGSNVEIVEFTSPEANGWRAVRQVGCCSGPFAVDSRLGVVWAQPVGASLQASLFPYYIYSDASANNNLVLPAVLSGMGFPSQLTTSQLVPEGDSPAWYLGFSSDGGFVGVAKLRSDGFLDSGWGRGTGVVRIDVTGRRDVVAAEGLADELRLINVRPGRNAVVLVTADGVVERRFAKSEPAHGQIVLVDGWTSVPEAAGVAKVRVARVGGADGAISVDYHFGIEATSCQVDACATRGIDFVGVDGRLDWADGDSSDRYVTIPISNDDQHEPDEVFGFELGTPVGGAIVVGTRLAALTIVDDDPTSAGRGGGGASQSGNSGGGGSINWLLLALLSSGALARRTAVTAVPRIRRLLVASTMLAVAAPAAWGGIGNMDPSYGDGGVLRLEVIGLPLQDGRLLYRTSGGFGRTDVDGRADPSFGNGGERTWPAGFRSAAWAQTVGGELLAAGTVQGPSGLGLALLRLRANGDIDATFGDGGIVSLPSQMAPVPQSRWVEQQVAVQLDGRILVLTEVFRSAYGVIEAMELARLLPDGTPDRTFGLGGVVDMPQGIGAEYFVMDALRDGRVRISGDELIYLTERGTFDRGVPTYDPELGATARHWALGAPTADGGRILISRDGESANGSSYLIARLKADGSVDRRFGQQRSGILTLSNPLASLWTIQGFVYSVDGRYLFASLSAGPYRAGLARYLASDPGAGSLDPAFGNGGVVELGRMFGVGPSVGTADGGVVVGAYPPAHFRLLGVDRPSPGFANLASDHQTLWREDQGPIKVRVSRLAGSSGPLRVRYSTATFEPSPDDPVRAARQGVDFESVSGELFWADGDNEDKTFSIPLLTDGIVEQTESMAVQLSSLTPGSWVGSETVSFAIADAAAPQPPPVPAPTPTPPSGSDRGGSGGGGAVGEALLALLVLARGLNRRSAT